MKYELETLKDVFDKVPADRIGACLHELAIAMSKAKAMKELMAVSVKTIGGQNHDVAVEWPETVTWVDDGKREINLHFRVAA